MKTSNKIVNLAIAAVVAAGLSGFSVQAQADTQKMEKCYGIVKAGKNDCGSKAHSCAGQAKTDAMSNEWIYLPKGTCDKIVGGSTTSK